MVVEADDDHAVIWTRPEDWQFDPEHPMAGLGHAHPDGFNAAFADGSVRFHRQAALILQLFQAMLTIAGGEVIRSSDY